MHKFDGIGWSTGKGWKSSNRGAVYFKTSSPKLLSLNKTVGDIVLTETMVGIPREEAIKLVS